MRMHPKRFKQRIEKAQKYITTRGEERQGFASVSGNKQQLTQSKVSELHKAILQVAFKLQNSSKETVLHNYGEQMEIRDHYIILQAPKLQQQRGLRQKQIKIWLGDICKHVFSVSFNYFSHKVFDTQTMQTFSSECMIGNIIKLSKVNNLTQQDFKLINLHLKNQILPYFLLRYPQSSNKQVNQRLNKQVSATDYLDTNMNNMFLKSKVKFEYRQNGIYFDNIMRFINYIQQLPAKKLSNQHTHTLFDEFNEKMQKLFTSVFNRKWTQANFYDEYNSSEETVQNLRQKVRSLELQIMNKSSKSILDVKYETRQEQAVAQSQKSYADSVKQYTKYAINRKVSQNVQTYSSQQIKHGNIKMLDPAILRIIVKWCTQLQQKFKTDYFLLRSQPFVMDNGDEVEMSEQLRYKLCQYAAIEWKQIQKFLKQIQTNIYQKQAQLSFNNLMYYSTQRLPEYEESIIKFANRNTVDVNHYAVCYLNRLIHGIMTIAKQIYDRHLNGWAEWPYPPVLLSFMISDLMRCKCFSKEKQIIRIYKQLQIQSEINPQIIRVVKVKNRLNRGTKDILLNVLFYKQVLCEIQLAIKVDQSQFSLWSDKFNHYIYELQRSTYGPITEMCSIWSSLDQRSSLLKDQKIRIPQFDHTCQKQQYFTQILPFTCSLCYKHFSESRYIYDHYKCSNCSKYWICALCRINILDEDSLINQLQSRNHTLQLKNRINQINPQFPAYFIGFKLESLEAYGQKFRKFNVDNMLMLARLQNGKLKVITIKKTDKKEHQKLFQNYLFFSQEKPDQQLSKITSQQALDETSLNEISQCFKKKSESLRIPGKKITKQLLLKINDARAQANIGTLSLPQNLIDSLKQIGSRFVNVKILNLNKNNIVSLQGLGRMNLLTDLYMGQNKFRQIIELDRLTHIKYVQLGDNPNAPQFKCDLSKLVHLQTLTLIRSKLPQFPIEVCKVQNLKLLWLFQNSIKTIPPQIGRLQNLQFLHLQMNELVSLPQQLFTLSKLIKLMLSYNKLTQISPSISKLKNLQLISLEDNPLKSLPVDDLMKLLCLKVLTINSEHQPLFVGKQITALLFR